MPKSTPIAVQPRWWSQAADQAAKLYANIGRVAKLLPTIEAHELTSESIDVIQNLLAGFSEQADDLNLELSAVRDGTSTYIVKGGGNEPGGDPTDLLGIAQGYLAGHVANGEVIAERVWDYGDGPDALPDAIAELAERVRALPADERKAANVLLLMNRDVGPTGTTPSAG